MLSEIIHRASGHGRTTACGCALLMLGVSGLQAVRADELAAGGGISVGVTADGNITRAYGEGNVLHDNIVEMNLSTALRLPVTEHSRFTLSGFGGVNAYNEFQGLSSLYAGLQGEFQYRPSGSFGSPILSVYLRAIADAYNSRLRDGYRYSTGLSAHKALTDRLDVFGALAYNLRDARSEVFDTQDVSVRANLDFRPTHRDTVYLGLEYRNGDIVSTARQSFTYVSMATAVAPDDAFEDVARYAYRMDGNTYLGTLGFNHALGERHSLDLSWRYVYSTPDNLNGYTSGSEIRYVVNQYTLAYLVRF